MDVKHDDAYYEEKRLDFLTELNDGKFAEEEYSLNTEEDYHENKEERDRLAFETYAKSPAFQNL
jgi:hypothetical protein